MGSDNPLAFQATGAWWSWFLGFGIALVVLGVIGLGSTALLSFTATLVLGPLLMAGGTLQVLLALFTQSRRESSNHLMAAALDLVVGLLVLLHPAEAAEDLILVLAVYLMAGGLYRILHSLVVRSPAWGLALGAGVVALSLGVLVRVHGPSLGFWLAGLCVAIDFLCHGTSWVVFSQVMPRSAAEAPEGECPPGSLAPRVTPHQPTTLGETGRGYKDFLDQGRQVLQQEERAIERVDELIHTVERKKREAHGDSGQAHES